MQGDLQAFVCACVAVALLVTTGTSAVRVKAAHSMSIYNPCQLTSVSCCNGMSCPHSDATCCPDGRHCCPKNSVCLPGAQCGFPVVLRPPVSTDVGASPLQPSTPPSTGGGIPPQPQPCACAGTTGQPNSQQQQQQQQQQTDPCGCNTQNNNNIYQDAQIAPMFAQPQQRNPLAVQIEKLAAVEQIIPPSLVESYNHLIASVNITIRLMGYNLDEFPIGTPQRSSWSRQLVRDVAYALNIPDQQVKILALSNGSIIASLSIQKPVDGSSNRLAPYILADQFLKAMQDATSYVYYGRITKYIDKNYFILNSNIVLPEQTPAQNGTSTNSSTAAPTNTTLVPAAPATPTATASASQLFPLRIPTRTDTTTALSMLMKKRALHTSLPTTPLRVHRSPADKAIVKELSGKLDSSSAANKQKNKH